MFQGISSIYTSPVTQVKVNGVLSPSFRVTNGTRQGCPLSSLLFSLSLEIFLCKIQSNPDIQGLTVERTQYKVSAYVDDMLFPLINPPISLPNLFHEMEIYFGINLSKSEAME